MKRFLISTLLALFCLINIQSKELAYYAPDDDVSIYFNKDNSIALIKQVVRFQKYNSWYIYRVSIDTNGDMHLAGVAEVKEASPKDNFVDKKIPSDITIAGLSSENPRISGKFNSGLTETTGGFNDRQWDMARSLVFYKDNPELFSPDSIAKLSASAYALIPSYREIISRAQLDSKQLKATHELKTDKRNSWGVFPLFIPFIIGLILYQIYIHNANDPKFLKWIALNEILGLVLTYVAFILINTYWWLIVLGVIAALGIQATNLFVVWNLKDVVVTQLHRKVPKWQSIVFGYVSMICIPGICSLMIMPFIPDIKYTIGTDAIFGAIAALVILIGLYLWYRSCIKKNVPQLGNHTLPIAIIVCFGAIAVLALIILIITFFIFKGTGKAFLNEGVSEPSMSLGGARDAEHSCARCGRLGDPSCPHFREQGTTTSSCSSWIPD
ncbi:MAG: hypothetical protein NC453_25870 [Muribaculum sp.]|nr:hypothetical protein [Muribaculum sp.]